MDPISCDFFRKSVLYVWKRNVLPTGPCSINTSYQDPDRSNFMGLSFEIKNIIHGRFIGWIVF